MGISIAVLCVQHRFTITFTAHHTFFDLTCQMKRSQNHKASWIHFSYPCGKETTEKCWIGLFCLLTSDVTRDVNLIAQVQKAASKSKLKARAPVAKVRQEVLLLLFRSDVLLCKEY